METPVPTFVSALDDKINYDKDFELRRLMKKTMNMNPICIKLEYLEIITILPWGKKEFIA